jgi:nitrogen fixation NifU-like protein
LDDENILALWGRAVSALYGDVIVERFRHPRRQGRLDGADAAHEDVNPLCGDRIRMEVRVGRGGGRQVEKVRFQGDACAIAVAAADLLAEMAEGRSVAEAARIDREALVAALRATIRPSRLACVGLPLHVFQVALSEVSAPGETAGPVTRIRVPRHDGREEAR